MMRELSVSGRSLSLIKVDGVGVCGEEAVEVLSGSRGGVIVRVFYFSI